MKFVSLVACPSQNHLLENDYWHAFQALQEEHCCGRKGKLKTSTFTFLVEGKKEANRRSRDGGEVEIGRAYV